MEGCVLSFLKAKWKVSDTGSAHWTFSLIGNDNNVSAEEHPSIKIIKENKKEITKLIFHEIENDFVSKQINKAIQKKQPNVMVFRQNF